MAHLSPTLLSIAQISKAYSIAASEDGQQVFVGENPGKIWKNASYGNGSWSEQGTTGQKWVTIACSDNGSNIIAGSRYEGNVDDGYVWLTSNAGGSWSKVNYDKFGGGDAINNSSITCVASSSDGSKLYFSVDGSTNTTQTNKSVDSGINWNSAQMSVWGSPEPSGPNSVACSSDGSNIVWALPSNVYKNNLGNYGAIYSLSPSLPNMQSIALSSNGSNFIACAKDGKFFHGIFTGIVGIHYNYTSNVVDIDNKWNSVACSGDFQTLAAAGSTMIVASLDGGANWVSTIKDSTKIWTSVSVSRNGQKIYACDGSNAYEIVFYAACLLKGTLVKTPNGYKPIELFAEGDFVTTHNNHVRRVTKVGKWVCSFKHHTLEQTVYKVPAGSMQNTTDLYISRNHRISNGFRLCNVDKLGFSEALESEITSNGQYMLYHLQIEQGVTNFLVVNGGCKVESWL